MKKWRHINAFRHVVEYIRYMHEDGNYPTITFEGVTKLHGTNAGIRRDVEGTFSAQGRNVPLFVGEDNYGFAAWLERRLQDEDFYAELETLFENIAEFPIETLAVDDEHHLDGSTTLFGEWIGKGINAKCAIHKFETKKFVIFGAYHDGVYVRNSGILQHSDPDILNVLDGGTFVQTINFNDLTNVPTELQALTNAVEAECPFGAAHGLEGIGEGIVWNNMNDPTNTDFWFKIKGDKHSGKGEKKPRRPGIAPEVLEKINELMEYILPHERLLQGLENVEGVRMESLGEYLKWIGQDVKREESDTIAASGFEWKAIAKTLNARAKAFFIDEINSV